jgi:hypothetical protein
MRLSSDAENPWLYACRTGDNQNFAALRSRAICTCTGSCRSVAKKKNRYGPLLRTVGLTTPLSQLLRMSHRPGWRRALGGSG